MSIVNKNIKYLRKLRNLTQQEFSQKLQIKKSSLGAYEEERAEPNMDTIFKVCEMFKLSLDEIFKKDLSITESNYLAIRRAKKLENTRPLIPLVTEKAAAGYLTSYSDETFIDELNTFTIPMITSGNYRAFEISGDSMLPTPSGSIVIGEKIESVEDLRNNLAYIIVSRSEGIVFKRIEKGNKTQDRLTLVSDNPTFHPYQIKLSEVLECWQAKYVLSKVGKENRWSYDSLATVVAEMQTQIAKLSKSN